MPWPALSSPLRGVIAQWDRLGRRMVLHAAPAYQGRSDLRPPARGAATLAAQRVDPARNRRSSPGTGRVGCGPGVRSASGAWSSSQLGKLHKHMLGPLGSRPPHPTLKVTVAVCPDSTAISGEGSWDAGTAHG